MSKQAELDSIFDKIAVDYRKLSERQQAYAVREIGRVRGELAILLADYAGDDGVIKRARINTLLRELNAIEKQIREYGTMALESIIGESAEWTTKRANGALTKFTGAAITATTIQEINHDAIKYVVNRFGDDGLILSDRIWATAADIREELSTVIRSSIIRGEGVSTMIPKLRQVHDNETWKIRRLAQTEGSTAYRTATAYNAQRSNVVDWVRINDRGAGHRNHHLHRCYHLAREDRYGQGAGIYKPTDSEIYMPHPNCRAYITYVLNEEYL